jgi:glyoxylate/hydroxypyruvate reductase
MNLLISMQGWDAAPWAERLADYLPGRKIIAANSPYDPESVHYAATWNHPPHSLAALKNLRVLFSLGAGVDHLFRDPGLPDVPIVRVNDADLRDRMSEYVLLHALLYHRQQRMYDYLQHEKRWEDDPLQPAAKDVRVGVMGLGVLGSDAARKLSVVGFDVAGWSRTPKELVGVDCFAGAAELDAFLARTDILVALLPLTPQTQGILNTALFAKLARDGRLGGPFLINVGRGKLHVEVDILAALDDGALRGATLDVFETEPLPAESPLWHHPQVTVTPHNSAVSEPASVARYIADQIKAFERGEPLRNVVDRARRY